MHVKIKKYTKMNIIMTYGDFSLLIVSTMCIIFSYLVVSLYSNTTTQFFSMSLVQ